MVLKRPLFVLFMGIILFICIWYHFMDRAEPVSMEKVPVQCIGQVDEIRISASGSILVLSDVEMIHTYSRKSIEVEKICIYDFSESNLFSNSKSGNILRVTGKGSELKKASNPGGFDEYLYYKSSHIDGKVFAESVEIVDDSFNPVKHGLFVLRKKAMEYLLAVMDEKDAGLLGAMILGEKSYLPQDTKELYQQTGIAHMLAISGLHISLLGAGLFYFLRSYVLPMKKAVMVTIIFLFCYGQFTGFPVATERAVIMMSFALFARYTGKSYDALSAMSFSGILILLQEPLQLFQCGFILSYTAISGVLLFAPAAEKMNIKNNFVKSLFSTVSVFVATLPIMLWFFYEICPYTIIVNLIVLPFLSLLVGVGIAGCIISFFWQDAGGFILSTAHYIMKFYEMVCNAVSHLPYGRVIIGRPSLCLIFIYYIVLLGIVLIYIRKEEKMFLCAGAGVLILLCCRFPSDISFLYTQLDVGQGDCACIFYKDQTYLIDGGSSSEKEIGKYTIQKFLKYYGRRQIDKVFISHSDADHTNGLTELIANQEKWGIRVKCVIMPEIQNPDDEYCALIRTFSRYNTSIYKMRKGQRLALGELSISCIHPFPEYDWEDKNDYSLTLDIFYRNIRILMTGDLEESGESTIQGLSGTYDILKVGHHGSKTSTSQDFLDMVSPEHAIISAGKNNRYGHPAPVTMEKLKKAGVRIWNTMECGAVFAESERGTKRVYSYRDKN